MTLTHIEDDLIEAVPIYKLLCPSTGALVGYEYRWNTGQLSILWLVAEIDGPIRISLRTDEH